MRTTLLAKKENFIDILLKISYFIAIKVAILVARESESKGTVTLHDCV